MAFARLVPGGPLAVIDGLTFSISKVITYNPRYPFKNHLYRGPITPLATGSGAHHVLVLINFFAVAHTTSY